MRVKTSANLKGLNKLREAFEGKKMAKVGVLGDGVQRDGEINNATLGLIHELGSPINNIPARSFLRMPVEHESEAITKAVLRKRGEIEEAMANGDMNFAYTQLGLAAEAAIIRAFATGGFGQWAPNAPSTIRAKGSASPLIDSGQLEGSITSEVVDES